MQNADKKTNNLSIFNKLYPAFFVIATVFMGIGYAAINSISMNIVGDVNAKSQNNVFITDVVYKSDNGAVTEESEILNVQQTVMKSNIVLSDTFSTSFITYTVTVYNNAEKDYMFVGTFFEDEFYSNANIAFELPNLKLEDVVKSKDYLTFDVTFKYKDGVVPTAEINTLKSYLNFKFEPLEIRETLSGIEFNYLIKNGIYSPEGDVYEYYSVDANRHRDESVKIIVFGKSSDYAGEVTDLVAEPIDVYRTGSISLYRRQLSDGTYKIYILSNSGKFILNANSAWMFDKLYILEEIVNLHLLDTSNVTNMRDMFCDCAKLKNVDLSNFDTSKVTNMIGMFARMTVIEYLDLTTFDTSKVTEVGQMFTTDTSLKKIYVSNKWDVSNVEAANGAGLFTSCTKLVGGNGTIYDETKITYTMAVVDGTQAGYLTNGYKFDTGIQVNHVIKNKTAAEIDAWTLSTRYSDTSVISITFGTTKDYYGIISGYTGVAVDSDASGVIKVYRIPNGSNYDVYIISNSGNFVVNEDAAWMFDKLIMLQKINNLNILDTSNVTNMRDMFCDCQTITNLNLSGFDTGNVVSMEGMFARTYHIQTLDLSSFNTKSATSIKNMFALNISTTDTHVNYQSVIPVLTTIYVSNLWTNVNVTADTVFTNTVNLIGGNGTKFDTANVTALYARADTSTEIGYFTLK